MGIANMHDYIARVEQAVRDNVAVGKVRVLGVIEVEVIEREDYWERMYYVAWTNERESGTHRVSINSKDNSALFYGHYQMTEDEAFSDLIKRSRKEVSA
jgi:hypothetical protein